MPSPDDSTSCVVFSHSSVKSGSPARTESPSRLSQPPKVPSSMFQPRRGIVIAMAMALASLRYELSDGADDAVLVGHDGRFERRAVRGRRVESAYAPDGCVEVVEPHVGHPRGDLGADA